MSQISHGTITVTDITDIIDVYLQYGLALANVTVTNSYAFNGTGEVGWSTTYPTWVSGYQIWVREVTVKEGIELPEYGTPYLDKAVNQINTNYVDLSNKLKTFFYPGDINHNYSGAFAVSKTESDGLNTANADTYGFNTRVATGLISMGYNKIPLLEMGLFETGTPANGIKLYSPILTNGVITNHRLDATLSTDGLKLLKGGIVAGDYAAGQNGYIYLSTENGPRISINGFTPGTGQNDPQWRAIIGTNFGVLSDGSLYASNVKVGGEITATTGSISGSVTIGGTKTATTVLNDIEEAGTKALNYITFIGDGGIKIHPYNATQGQTVTNDYVQIDSAGMIVVENNKQRAKFGSATIIGKPYVANANDNESHIELDYHSLKFADKEGNEYFYVSDLRDSTGKAVLTEIFSGDGSSTQFELNYRSVQNYGTVTVISATIDGNAVTYTTSQGALSGNVKVIITPAPANEAEIIITYEYTGPLAKAYTLGRRDTNYAVAPFSYAEGNNVVADKIYSHAEGFESKAMGKCSHAEGSNTSAYGKYSHAEGYGTSASGIYSHAEGMNTYAKVYAHAEGSGSDATGHYSHAENWDTQSAGQASHAEGYKSTAYGDYSHAEGWDTYAYGVDSHTGGVKTNATRKAQTVIGRYNEVDEVGESGNDYGKYAFIIGNGTGSDARSNALTVDWDGNLTCSNIGQRKYVSGTSSTSNVTNAADAYVTIGSLPNVPKGLWVVNCRARFVPNSGTTGNNYPVIGVSTNSSAEVWHQRTYTSGTTNAQLNTSEFLNLTNENNTIYLRGMNNQAGYWTRKNSAQFMIDAIRIK